MYATAFKNKCWQMAGMIAGLLFLAVVVLGLYSTISCEAPFAWIEEPILDIGVVYPAELMRSDAGFKILNRGTEDLVINSVVVSCACLHPTLTNDVIAPGDFAILTVRLIPPRRQGPWSEKILLRTNDPERLQIPLEVRAIIREKVQVVPSTVEVSVQQGQDEEISLSVIVPYAIEGFDVRDVSSKSGLVSLVRKERLDTPSGGNSYWKLDLLVHGGGEDSKDEIAIVTSDPEQPAVVVPVVVKRERGVIAQPSVLMFRPMEDAKNSVAEVSFVFFHNDYDGQVPDIQSPEWLETRWVQGIAPHIIVHKISSVASGTKGDIVLKFPGSCSVVIDCYVIP